MEEYYTLQTPGHFNDIFIELLTLQEQGVLCDVILNAEDGEVMAHKVVLMAVSKYFRDKLSPVLGVNPTQIGLKGISAVELANLIQYIYTGNLLVAKESMDVILEISEILGLSGVVQGYNEIILYEEGKRQKEKSIQSSVESTMTSCHATDVVNQDSNYTVVASSTAQSSTADQHQNADQGITKNSVGSNPNIIESANQSTAADYNFGSLYDQQYVDVTAGSNSPLKNSPACGSQTKHPVKSEVSAEEEAQHQTLSDAPYLKHQGQPELEKAVMNISYRDTADAGASLGKPIAENTVDVGPFINGKTNTKTLTMSAGTVNNDQGGQTDVYTVSLDPLSVKTPLVMPKPRRSKPRKEKDAEEKVYRQKKAQILQSDIKDIITEQVSLSALKTENVAELDESDETAERSSSAAQNQGDFQYETKMKAAFVPRVIFTETKLKEADPVNNEKIVDGVVDAEAQANRQQADDFAQVVKADSVDAEHEINGMIANDIVSVMNNTSDSESNTLKGVYAFTKGKNNSQSQDHIETKIQPKTNTNRNNQTDNDTDLAEVTELVDTGAPEKYTDNSDVSMSPKRHSDEATEKMRSSAQKRKTRTPKIESFTESENKDYGIVKQVKASDLHVFKSLMPEVRLKKLSLEEILQIAKDFKEKKVFNYSSVKNRTCGSALNDEKAGDIETAGPITTKSAISNELKRKLADEPDTGSPSKARNINDQDLSDTDNFCEEASDSSIPAHPSGSKDVKLVAEFIVPACNDGTYKCEDDICLFSTDNMNRLKHHVYMFHGPGEDVQVVEQSVEEEVTKSTDQVTKFTDSDDYERLVWKNVDTDEILCPKCPRTFKTPMLMKKHYIASHSGNKFKCPRCDYVAGVQSNLKTHMKLKHSIAENGLSKCRFCNYGSSMRTNLRSHILAAHGLIMVTTHMANTNQKFYNFNDGDIVTLDGKLFDPKTMPVPKNEHRIFPKKTIAQHTKSLLKVPVKVFVEEVIKRHDQYLKQPEKEITCKCNSIIKATEQPLFPQASPQVQNNHANKVHTMQRMKLPVQEPRVHGYITNQGGIPGVDNKVEVTQHGYPEVVMENVESGESNDVLLISEQTDETDGEEMIIINQSGKQTAVRSKDFYDTLSASGHDSNQTLEMIATLLQAGEQIEIREQNEEEEFVEIQNA